MQRKRTAGFFIEALVVVSMLSILAAIAIPNLGQLVNKDETESYESEFQDIQTAVSKMLARSTAGNLKPVGPTADMGQVQTNDVPPLALTDYLIGLDGTSVKSGCTYTFAADGTVRQIPP